MIELDLFVDAIFGSGLAKVIQDRRTISDRLCFFPGFETETQSVHVTVGAHAGVTEQIPGATKIGATFEDCVRAVGALILQVIGHANTRDSGTDD
jgi:hypothetical protein